LRFNRRHVSLSRGRRETEAAELQVMTRMGVRLKAYARSGLSCFVCLGIAACTDSDRGGTVLVTDSAGVEIVESTEPAWTAHSRWSIRDPADLEIPRDGDAGLSPFGTIGDVIALPDGRILVGSVTNPPAIVMFSEAGTSVRTIGRVGEGPGEFTEVSRLWFAAPDSIVVYDRALLRISHFSLSGRLRSTTRVEPTVTEIGLMRNKIVSRFPDGSFVARPGVILAVGPRHGRRKATVIRARPDGSVLDTLGRFDDMEYLRLSNGIITTPLLGKRAGMVSDGVGFYRGIGDRFVVDYYDLAGRHLRRLKRAHAPREITDDLKDEIIETLVSRFGDEDGRGEQMLGERLVSSTLPAFGDAWLVDSEGYLWVPGYALPQDETVDWSVFSPLGAWLGTVEMPKRFQPKEIGASYVLGIWKGGYDVESVRKYSLDRSKRVR